MNSKKSHNSGHPSGLTDFLPKAELWLGVLLSLIPTLSFVFLQPGQPWDCETELLQDFLMPELLKRKMKSLC